MLPNARLTWSLLLLRLGVFVVMFMWTIDKFVNPGHAARILDKFYGLSGFGTEIVYVLAAVEMVLILAFVAGMWKRWTYGFVLVLHGLSTFSAYKQYLDPFAHLLFFAAWPMLAACFALYLLRDLDTRWTITRSGSGR
ncbi:hypothetical protein Q4526_02695 [Gilvimarinus sp. 2_MG-2023]|uniref:hypothetical protein n=1 Tax=Gilvimarinus sp. 2_MG-2023 TaxID=3062666 RepID=UPI0026E29930|nr:hypothetical protein [Gilvimarinus sp. 2_MG-2023]MDO6569840.1 hypothetical protein [Gilvimarinus sp. 2_MG-2023]